jgi:hypothetical protein
MALPPSCSQRVHHYSFSQQPLGLDSIYTSNQIRQDRGGEQLEDKLLLVIFSTLDYARLHQVTSGYVNLCNVTFSRWLRLVTLAYVGLCRQFEILSSRAALALVYFLRRAPRTFVCPSPRPRLTLHLLAQPLFSRTVRKML